MTRISNAHLIAYALGAIVAFALIVLFTHQQAQASAIPGIVVNIATSSNPAVSTTAGVVFATSSCSARIITTYASPVMITFTDAKGASPTGLAGHLQAASTTVAYDAERYGCGTFKIYSFVAQNITVSESR